MVHSEHILISISTTQILYKKSVSLYKGYIDFFQNYPCQRQRFLNVHLNNEVVLIPFWFPPPRISFFLFNMHKTGVFGADFEVINTRFYHWEVLWKNVSHSTYIYI